MKARNTTTLFGALLCALSASCALPSIKALPADPPPADISQQGARSNAQPAWAGNKVDAPQLYARDGSLVNAQKPGTLTVSPETGQSVGEEKNTRWTLLEQYQSSVQHNEELEIELRALTLALEQSEAREEQLSAELVEQKAQMAELEERLGTLGGHNVELASRLTTAQIRRLQSEKLLLEAKLDWKRVETMINMPGQGAKEQGQPASQAQPRPSNAEVNGSAVGSRP